MASAAGPVGGNNDGGNGVNAGSQQPPPPPPQQQQQLPPEESIEFLQREIELLKRRIVEERLKLCDKTIVQVKFKTSWNVSG